MTRVAAAWVVVAISAGLSGVAPQASAASDPAIAVVSRSLGIGANTGAVLDGGQFAILASETDGQRDLNGDGDRLDLVVQVLDPVTGVVTSSRTSGVTLTPLPGGRVAFPTLEESEGGTDLNGDGDALDTVEHVFDPASGRTTNLKVDVAAFQVLPTGGLALQVQEARQGRDFNGDGDKYDFVLAIWDPASGVTNLRTASVQGSLRVLDDGRVTFLLPEPGLVHNRFEGDPMNYGTVAVWSSTDGVRSLGVVTESTGAPYNEGALAPLSGGGFAVTVSETRQGPVDLNGDGDTTDEVIHVWSPAGGLQNLRLASALQPGRDRYGPFFTSLPDGGTAILVSETHHGAVDLNGDGDTTDDVVQVWRPGLGVTNLGLAGELSTDTAQAPAADLLPLLTSEAADGRRDLNGDNDTADLIHTVWTPAGGLQSLGLAGRHNVAVLPDGSLAFDVVEADQGSRDLTGEGAADDNVLFVRRPDGLVATAGVAVDTFFPTGGGSRVAYRTMEWYTAQDHNDDGDDIDPTGGLYDPTTGTVVRFGVAVEWTVWVLGDGRYVVLVDEAAQGAHDLNGDGDTRDKVMELITVALPSGPPPPVPVETPPAIPVPVPVATPDPLAAITSSRATAAGYWMLTSTGDVHAFGAAAALGSPAVLRPARGVDIEPAPGGQGYWILDSAGDVHAYGNVRHQGRVNRTALATGEEPAALSATPSGNGYWVFTNRGRAIPFGDAPFLGDMSAVKLNGPVLGSVATPSGRGYYMVASDGGIFAFGDAKFAGSMGGKKLNAPVQSLVPDSDGKGYWLVASDGGIFAFDAPFRGSMGGTKLNKPVVGMVRYGDGYLMVGADGGIFNFSTSPFAGSLGDKPPTSPVVAVAALP